MEVFMHGLPDHNLSARSLEEQLMLFMKPLGISRESFTCEKSPAKRIAHLTFSSRSDAEKFLLRHSEIDPLTGRPPTQSSTATGTSRRINGRAQRQGPKPRARLHILGTPVWCRASDRPADEITVRAIKHAAEVARAAEKERLATGDAKDYKEPSVDFQVHSFSCGHYAYIARDLVFFPEQEWARGGNARFTKLNLTVTLTDQVQIRIPLSSIHEIVWAPSGLLTLTLVDVPYFFTDEYTLADLLSITKLSGPPSQRDKVNRMIALDEAHEKIVGYCLIYQFCVSVKGLQQNISKLERRNFTTITRYHLRTMRQPHPTLGDFRLQLDLFRQDLNDAVTDNSLPFALLFVLQALLFNAYMHPGLLREMVRELRRRHKAATLAGRRTISAAALKILMENTDFPSPYGDPSHFELAAIMDWVSDKHVEVQSGYDLRSGELQSPNLTYIFRAVVTPTRITLHGPEVENKNRVLRKHPMHQDYFLRVQFCDEGSQDLRYEAGVSVERVYERFKDVLLRGIQLPGRIYSFLGFSHSSLRTSSVWFCAPFIDNHNGSMQRVTHKTIIEQLGKFTHIRCPAKFAARIGQAFSETPSVLPLSSYGDITIKYVSDIYSADRQRCFSDGVGSISEEMMKIIWTEALLGKSAPTCFQIRHAGCKGMLALDTTLPGKTIYFRESMKKFDSNDQENLEICDTGSKATPLVLNRQMIKILEDMGVDKKWFMKLQGYRLKELQAVTSNAYNVKNFLHTQNVGQPLNLGKFIYFAHQNGMDYKHDPFLRGVVEAVVLRELRLLKHKARIPVSKGKTLFGLIDETGLLGEGQVYVTFASEKTPGFQKPPRHKQMIVVTRSPALHPGDIQVAQNIIPPVDHPLAAHQNCIFFSQKGSRDLPSMLSGGDLDGDIYNVIWDEEAMPTQTFQPADYPSAPPQDIGRPVVREDIVQHFVDFMKNDNLGAIATRHMILADQMQEGTLHPACLKLAELHSTAVDFSKTGVPVNMKELPRSNKYRPDFLSPGPIAHLHDQDEIFLEQYRVPNDDEKVEHGEAPHHKFYKSRKVLGELYREVDEEKIWHEDVHRGVVAAGASFWETFLRLVFDRAAAVGAMSWSVRVEEARRIKAAYEDAISGHMCRFSDHPVQPISELEVFIGHIHNKRGPQTHRQRDSSHKLRDAFDRTAAYFTRQMRRGSASLAPNQDGSDDDEPVPLTGYQLELGPSAPLDLCLACVCVSSLHDCRFLEDLVPGAAPPRRRNRGGEHADNGLRSFRVVAAAALMKELRMREGALMGDGTSRGGGGFVGVSG
ncbi:RNA-dependent RNA polymerase [Magnaporthiopsis poae ATCC 64411]|uniref:RNA-dependent RNA polymerase n=1 Tax=Magnaporthiopsis poae (strain ATCC 64411 / 73-15) TaxID=644358 RepID=A0A0C4E499_MAGP6|nr:RNA-dependent RNA polymerase [Magnaporthiopsis poae ATCC 64411]